MSRSAIGAVLLLPAARPAVAMGREVDSRAADGTVLKAVASFHGSPGGVTELS